MKKRAKTDSTEMKTIYQFAPIDSEEAERRLNAAYDILFDAVFKDEEKNSKEPLC